jgi:hypothetical protein
VDGDPQVLIGAVGRKDDLEAAAPTVDADEVGVVAVDEQWRPGMTDCRDQFAFRDTSMQSRGDLDPCHASRVLTASSTRFGYVVHIR